MTVPLIWALGFANAPLLYGLAAASVPILIHLLNRLDSKIVIRQLLRENDPAIRRALILGLGSYTENQISPDERRKMTAVLLRWYETDNDAGVHSAIDWLLRHGHQGDRPRHLDWHQGEELAALEKKLERRGPDRRRGRRRKR